MDVTANDSKPSGLADSAILRGKGEHLAIIHRTITGDVVDSQKYY